jgi:hypothetical protein
MLSANHVGAYTRSERTELDQLVLKLLNFVLQKPVCVLREERDDMLELCATSSFDPTYAHQACLTTYRHLAVIDRVEVLKRIDSRRLSPCHQRQITSCHAIG